MERKEANDEGNTAENSQKLQLMSMFTESSLTRYQRVVKPAPVASTEESDEENKGSDDVPAAEGATNTNNDPAKDDRTLFVGNLPISMDQKAIIKLFKEYGKIESVRIRSIPIAGMKVDKAGDQNLVKKVSAVRHTFGDQKSSFNAYVVFEDAASVEPALVENNRVIDNRHIRVDRMNPTLFDTQRSLFIGNLPYRVDEEEVREYFAKVLPHGQDDIEGIRIIRDPETLIGKGIAYLLLKTRENILDAIRLHDTEFKKNWKIRVATCSKKSKKRSREQEEGGSSGNSTSRVSKKPKTEKELIAKNALKRINLKTIQTKKKLLEARKNKGPKKNLKNKNNNNNNKGKKVKRPSTK
eukprot:gene7171-7742_t